jgi:glycosyltransferase involved in cell wall biosynthesis
LVTGVLRLSEEKQPLVFVEIARRILAQRDDVCFALAGDGPMASEVNAAATRLGPRFQILGRRTDVPELLAASDVAFLTSRIEGTPNVLLEAQWLGVPVVAARVGGVGDAVQHGHTGILADRPDVDSLTEALRVLLRDEALRRRCAAAGPLFVEQRFGLSRMVNETVQSYD